MICDRGISNSVGGGLDVRVCNISEELKTGGGEKREASSVLYCHVARVEVHSDIKIIKLISLPIHLYGQQSMSIGGQLADNKSRRSEFIRASIVHAITALPSYSSRRSLISSSSR